MWKTLEELEKYLYMSQDETLRRAGQSLITLVEQEIEARVEVLMKHVRRPETKGTGRALKAGKIPDTKDANEKLVKELKDYAIHGK